MDAEELAEKLRQATKENEDLHFLVTYLQLENKRLLEENRRLKDGDEPIVIPSYANPFACGD